MSGPSADQTHEPAGRPRERGVRRRKRDATMDAGVVERVEQLATARYGGNYSAALQAAAERGLAELEPLAERVARFDAELEQGRTDA